ESDLLDYLVDAGEQQWGNSQPERLSRLEIDYQFKFGRLLDWQIARLSPLENLIHVIRRAPEQVRNVRAVGHEAARFNELSVGGYRWHAVLCSEIAELFALII